MSIIGHIVDFFISPFRGFLPDRSGEAVAELIELRESVLAERGRVSLQLNRALAAARELDRMEKRRSRLHREAVEAVTRGDDGRALEALVEKETTDRDIESAAAMLAERTRLLGEGLEAYRRYARRALEVLGSDSASRRAYQHKALAGEIQKWTGAIEESVSRFRSGREAIRGMKPLPAERVPDDEAAPAAEALPADADGALLLDDLKKRVARGESAEQYVSRIDSLIRE